MDTIKDIWFDANRIYRGYLHISPKYITFIIY